MPKIMIDAGHDQFTAGKGVPSMKEFEFNKAVAEYLQAILRTDYDGFEVYQSHNLYDGIDTSLADRVKLANNLGVHSYISIHANAGPSAARGIETFIHTTRGDNEDYKFALLVHNHVVINTGMNSFNRGVKRADFQVLRTTNLSIEVALIECGFMTNAQDLALLKSDAYRRKVAYGIAYGIAAYHGIKQKPGAGPVEEKPTPAAPAPAPVVEDTDSIPFTVLIDNITYDEAKTIVTTLQNQFKTPYPKATVQGYKK